MYAYDSDSSHLVGGDDLIVSTRVSSSGSSQFVNEGKYEFTGTNSASESIRFYVRVISVTKPAGSSCSWNSDCMSGNCEGRCCSSSVGSACNSCSSSGSCNGCSSGSYLSGGVCYTAVSAGGSCSSDSRCASGLCRGGRCCSSSSNSLCSSCNSLGSCSSCSYGYSLNSYGSCEALRSSGSYCNTNSQCWSGSCKGGYCCSTSVDYRCSGCGSDGSCAYCSTGYYVSGNSCYARKAPGSFCSSFFECQSLRCFSGYCCDSGRCLQQLWKVHSLLQRLLLEQRLVHFHEIKRTILLNA